jgi:GTPase SAR1 family protein
MNSVSVGLCGEVSVGKTTILNSILGHYLGQIRMKRTTYLPFCFEHEPYYDNSQLNDIKGDIEKKNENKDEDTMVYPVRFNWINVNNVVNFSVTDFPGFNDGKEENNKMENILFDNLHKLDYIIYIIDSTKCLNSKSERELLEKLFNKIYESISFNHKFHDVIILFNKYDEEDEEIDEMIEEATLFMQEKWQSIFRDLDMHLLMFKISGRKMMVREILKNNVNGMETIPTTIIRKILSEHHGKKKAEDIIKSGKIDEKELSMIELTKDESEFHQMLWYLANSDKHYIKYLKFVNDKCELLKGSVDEVMSSLMIIMKKCVLFEKDTYEIINKTIFGLVKFPFVDIKNVYVELLILQNIVTNYICYDLSDKLDINKLIAEFCDEMYKCRHFNSTMQNRFSVLNKLLNVFSLVDYCDFTKHVEHLLKIEDKTINIDKIFYYIEFINKNNVLSAEFIKKLDTYIVWNSVELKENPKQICLNYEFGYRMYVNYINSTLDKSIKMNYEDISKNKLEEEALSKYSKYALLKINNEKLEIKKKNLFYYPNDILTQYMVREHLDKKVKII